MITLDESVYVECFWYVNLDTQNYMGMLMRVDGQWFIKYRFREHHDSKVFDSEDKRAWYRITPRKGVPPEQAQRELFEMFDTITRELAARELATVSLVMVRGDGLAAARAIGAQPWGHVRWDGEPA